MSDPKQIIESDRSVESGSPVQKRQSVTVNVQTNEHAQLEIMVTFDSAEARGQIGLRPKVLLQESIYGLEIILPQAHPTEPVVYIDLYHGSPVAQEAGDPDTGIAQIILHSPIHGPDPMGRVRFYPDKRGTRVDFELGVGQFFEAEDGRMVVEYGYPVE